MKTTDEIRITNVIAESKNVAKTLKSIRLVDFDGCSRRTAISSEKFSLLLNIVAAVANRIERPNMKDMQALKTRLQPHRLRSTC